MWLKQKDTRSPEYLRLVDLIARRQFTPDQLPALDALIAQQFGPAYALRGALLLQRDGSKPRNNVGVNQAGGYWLTGAADHNDGASRVLYDLYEMEKMDKFADFTLEDVVDLFLRSETHTKREDPDARYFMIGYAAQLGHEDYARELNRRP